MNKRILVIGNTDGLPGVKVDLLNYCSFFKSPVGGNWEDGEIIALPNPTKSALLETIVKLKIANLDYLIVIFSGHGGQERETVLEINSAGETINDSVLKNIAIRQLNIFDCCRSFPQYVTEGAKAMTFSEGGTVGSTRIKFERRIMQAIPQQVSLYSCSIGQVSHDTTKGGLYSTNLIDSAKKFTSEYQLVGQAHETAAALTIAQTLDKPINQRQNPEAHLLRCLSSQQLIIGVRL